MSAAGDANLASVIVAVNPHDHQFGTVMDAWAGQGSAGDYEVIVAHDGVRPSLDDEYVAHRARHPRSPVRLVGVDGQGRAASNNAGVRASRGALLVFVADDFRPSRALLAAHRRFHALGNGIDVGVGPNFYPRAHREAPFRRWAEDTGMLFGMTFPLAALEWREDYFYVGNASMMRSTFDAVGPFDERFRYDLFDDFEWGRRLPAHGIATRLVPRAIAWHDHEVTLEDRMASSTLMGEAAARHERSRGAGPWPWSPLTDQPLELLEATAREQEARAAAAGTIEASHRLWKVTLNLAFLRGYVAERPPASSPPA